MIRCPGGTFGNTTALNNDKCSGPCEAGYFCPPASTSARQIECGSDRGVTAPCYPRKDGSNALQHITGERHCSVSIGVRDVTTHQGTGWDTITHYETEDLTPLQPLHYHYHVSSHSHSRNRTAGGPSSVYCPEGSARPTQVVAGFYTIGGNETTNRTRVAQKSVEPGYFAEEGIKYRCPPGTYGKSYALTMERCSGLCPAAHYCPWATDVPIPCPDGTYSSGGLFQCMTCPRRPGSESAATCKSGRHCCFI